LIVALAPIFACLVPANAIDHEMGVVIDAGSSHSKVFVYEWQKRMSKTSVSPWTPPTTQKGWSAKFEPGISSYADKPSGVRAGLQKLVDFAKKIVAEELWANTPIYLGATAGMRLLPLENRTAIMQEVRRFFASSSCPFSFGVDHQARILSGDEEGVYGWIAVNFLKNSLTDAETSGVLDLGGASTQITFRPKQGQAILSNSYPMHVHGLHLPVYSHSFLNYGINTAKQHLHDIIITSAVGGVAESGCYNTGYNFTYKGVMIRGASNGTACETQMKQLFQKAQYCYTDTCSFNQVYQPPLYGRFVGISTFYSYIVTDLSLPENASISLIRSEAMGVCSLSYSQLLDKYPQSHALCYEFCIGTTYIETILGYAYGFNLAPEATITYQSDINGCEATWGLGMIINEIHQMNWKIIQSGSQDTCNGKVSFSYAIVTFCLVAVFAVIILLSLGYFGLRRMRSRRRSPSYTRAPTGEASN